MVQYVGEKPYNKLELLITPDAGSYVHFQDNGEDFAYKQGEYNLYQFTVDAEGTLHTEFLHQGYPVYEEISCRVVGK